MRDLIVRGLRREHAVWPRNVAKDPPYDPDRGGVPPEMFAGPVDSEGWVEWKFVESTLTDEDIQLLEGDLGRSIPDDIKEYLLVPYCHLVDQVRRDDDLFTICAMPSDNPLREFRRFVFAWRPLLQFGYFPFAEYQDGWGPICRKDNDGRVIWFDHEEMGADLNQGFIEGIEKPLAANLEAFWEMVFDELQNQTP